jgi:transposase
MIRNEVLNEKTTQTSQSRIQVGSGSIGKEHGDSCATAGRSLDVRGALSGRWKCELEGHTAEAFPGKGKRTAKQQHIHEPESENRRLRLERAILKKAMAFFAKESA